MSDVKMPSWASEKQIEQIKSQSQGLMVATKEQSGPSLSREIDRFGQGAHTSMQKANDLMNGSVSSLLTGLNGESPTANKLLQLRGTMDEMNPHSLQNAWYFGFLPKPFKRKVISKFVHRYQSNKTHVSQILDGLRSARDELLDVSLQLEHQYDQVMSAKKEIDMSIVAADLFLAELDEYEKTVNQEDDQEIRKINSTRNQVARRKRDLATMQHAALQFFVSIDMTIESNTLIGEQIQSALTVGPMVMKNALAIQAALAKQKTVAEAVEQYQDGISDMMKQNAAATKTAAQNATDLYNNPVMSLESMAKSHDDLMSAVTIASDAMAKSTVKALEAADALKEMSVELEPVAGGLRESREQRKEMDKAAAKREIKDIEGTDETVLDTASELIGESKQVSHDVSDSISDSSSSVSDSAGE